MSSDPEAKLEPLVFTQPPSQLLLRWMLPVEVWQKVLGFCPLQEYKTSAPACREFYLLRKQSLLELPPLTPALGGLWLATSGPMANLVRVLRMPAGSVSAKRPERPDATFVASSAAAPPRDSLTRNVWNPSWQCSGPSCAPRTSWWPLTPNEGVWFCVWTEGRVNGGV